MAYASPGGSGERADCLTQGHRLSHADAYLFAQARTFRIIQFNGFTYSTGSIDLTARASAILATAPLIFMRFRELMSARGNALLQLLGPIQDDNHTGRTAPIAGFALFHH
jgi:hypothetical protein